jgi:hypothetical protein
VVDGAAVIAGSHPPQKFIDDSPERSIFKACCEKVFLPNFLSECVHILKKLPRVLQLIPFATRPTRCFVLIDFEQTLKVVA